MYVIPHSACGNTAALVYKQRVTLASFVIGLDRDDLSSPDIEEDENQEHDGTALGYFCAACDERISDEDVRTLAYDEDGD